MAASSSCSADPRLLIHQMNDEDHQLEEEEEEKGEEEEAQKEKEEEMKKGNQATVAVVAFQSPL